MKKAIRFVVWALWIFVATAGAHASGDVARIEEHGTMQIAGESLVKTFVVTIGTPHFAVERAGLASIFGVYLANAQFFIKVPDKGWIMQERRVPEESDLNDSFPNNLIVQRSADEGSMPLWFRNLPPRQKENIEGFLAFYSGAFRIYLSDQTEAAAEELAQAVNKNK